MSDRYEHLQPGLDAPYQDGAAVTPDDGNDLAVSTLALWIGTAGAGTLRVTTVRGTVLNFANIAAGTLLRVRVKRVHATGTGVSDIVALY